MISDERRYPKQDQSFLVNRLGFGAASFRVERMAPCQSQTDPALKERAIRLVREHRGEYPSSAQVISAVARQESVGKETLRRWVRQADIDAGETEGQTSEEYAEIKRLKAENKRLREDVAILKAATTFFAGEPGPRNR